MWVDDGTTGKIELRLEPVQIVSVIRNGSIREKPGFVIGASPEQVIPGWDKGLTGQTVGSRVMLSVPPAQGYGSAGASQAGINGKDTLVFVVDIIDALKRG